MDTPTQENQHEFFPDFVKPSDRKVEPRLPGIGDGRTHKPILFTTTIEQLLFASIVAILVLCGVYFLGILRGKSIAGAPDRPAARTVQIPRAATPVPPVMLVQASTPARPAPTTASRPALPTLSRPAQLLSPAVTTVRSSSPAAAPKPGVARRLYTIQVVTHKKRAFAEGELAAVGQAGFSGRILESDGYFVVCVGQYTAKEEAKKDLAFLRAKYPDCFLRRL